MVRFYKLRQDPLPARLRLYISTFTLLQWSETEPTIAPRCACVSQMGGIRDILTLTVFTVYQKFELN